MGGPSPLVGRDTEVEAVTAAVRRAADGTGGTVAVIGPAGVGKSRVAREALRLGADAGLTMLAGRAVATGLPMPYRPFVEALSAWARTRQDPPDLGPHTRALGAVVPGWDSGGDEPLSPLFVAEALLRLLPQLAGAGGVVLLLEDLHWADRETLAVLEYVADAAPSLPLLVVTTARDDEGAEARRLLRSLAARGSARLLALRPLDVTETRRVAEDRLGTAVAPAMARLVLERTDGLPLFVEELVATLATTGGLTQTADGLDVQASAVSVLPATVADAVASRLDQLNDADRDVIEAAALLGRSFDTGILAERHGDGLLPALQRAAAAGLLDEDPSAPGRLRFRHALLRDAVVAATFAPRRALLAGALLDLLQQRPLTGDALSVAVELAARADDIATAARLALRRASEALDGWALATAEQSLAEARRHAASDPDLLTEIDVAQLRVASIVGRIDVVTRIATALLTRLQGLPDHETDLIEAHLRLSQALLDEERWEEAAQHLDAAAPLVEAVGEPCTLTRLELQRSLAARLRGDAAEARERAAHAVELARPYDDQGDLVCAALLAEGRALLPDAAAARDRWTQALRVADAHAMRLWRARMLTELATLRVDELAGDVELAEAAALARETGGVATQVRVALLQARLALLRGDLDAAVAALDAAESDGVASAASRRTAADLHAAMAALRHQPVDAPAPQVRVLQAMLADDVEAARAAAAAVTTEAGTALGPIVDVVAERPRSPAVRQARDLLPDLPAAVAVLADAPLLAALFTCVWARSADGVREPLQTAAAVLDRLDLTRAAEAARGLLRADGVPLPRRASAQEGVPERLRAAGVTARELDVLRLLAHGASNREMAAELYLSPRTVEKHVERLLMKTGAPNRTALAALALRMDEGATT